MAKSGNRQDSKKKRDKRRLLKQQALPVRQAWQDVDVSAWFDNTVGLEADVLDVFYPKAEDLPSPVYIYGVPGDLCFSYYACTHPELKDEAEAVVLVKKLMLFEKSFGKEKDADKGPAKTMLDKLKKMARAGSVTASCCLGNMYVHGTLVRRNLEKGRQYLEAAASKDDPVACYWLAALSDELEETKLLQKSCECCCPSALTVRLSAISHGRRSATSSEIDVLAENSAALAGRGSLRNLVGLLSFLSSDCGEGLRRTYAPAMLSLLDRLAAEGCGLAIHYQAVVYSLGILRPADAGKASQLYLKAHEMGEDTAGLLYATHLLRTVSDSDMPRREKTARTQPARKMLEELYSQGRDMPKSAGVLGCMLVMSDDDDDFRKGIQCLEESLSGGQLRTALHAVHNILLWSDDPERHRLCIRLLNSLVRKKDKKAICLRGRYYLDGGLCGNQNVAKGLEMLEQAADMGEKDACLFLGEVYLFGLYNCEPDFEKAQDMLLQGSSLKSKPCKILHALMQLGEIPECPASVDEKTAGPVLWSIKDNFSQDDQYLTVTYALCHLNAESQFRKYGHGTEFVLRKFSKQEELDMLETLAEACDECMLTGSLGPLCYMAYAMGKIGRTESADQYAAVMAAKLRLPEGTSCDGIADFLYDYVDAMPESYVDYRLKYNRHVADEEKPLY